MADDKKEELKMPLIHGMPWFPGTTQEMIDTFPRLLARENDIFVATYAKAGKYNNNVPVAQDNFAPRPRMSCRSYHFARRRSCLFRKRSMPFSRHLENFSADQFLPCPDLN